MLSHVLRLKVLFASVTQLLVYNNLFVLINACFKYYLYVKRFTAFIWCLSLLRHNSLSGSDFHQSLEAKYFRRRRSMLRNEVQRHEHAWNSCEGSWLGAVQEQRKGRHSGLWRYVSRDSRTDQSSWLVSISGFIMCPSTALMCNDTIKKRVQLNTGINWSSLMFSFHFQLNSFYFSSHFSFFNIRINENLSGSWFSYLWFIWFQVHLFVSKSQCRFRDFTITLNHFHLTNHNEAHSMISSRVLCRSSIHLSTKQSKKELTRRSFVYALLP